MHLELRLGMGADFAIAHLPDEQRARRVMRAGGAEQSAAKCTRRVARFVRVINMGVVPGILIGHGGLRSVGGS